MRAILILSLLLAGAVSYNFPLYKQCDPAWANQQLGYSSDTICSAGCLMSSVAMALTGIGKSFNPSTLNTWLKGHGGYVSGDLFVWGSVNQLGLTFAAKVPNARIKINLDVGNIVILNVHNGGHWVLATGYSGDTIYVHDPGYNVGSYNLNQIVDGQNAVYRTPGSKDIPSLQSEDGNVFAN